MSYNIMGKNASFKGDVSGTIENQVNDWDNQSISGNKTFTAAITSSADVMLSGSGKISASFFYGDGTGLSGVGGTAAGADRQVQFNDGGTDFGASANFNFTAANELQVTGQISASLGVSGSEFHGDGSNLTAVTASFVTASNVDGILNASQVNLGEGLEDNSNAIRVKLTSANSGLSLAPAGISLDVSNLNARAGYSDTDVIAVHMGSGTEKLTLSTLEQNLEIDGGQITGANSIDTTVLPVNITASGHVSASAFFGDGTALTGVIATPTPAGSNTQIQFNSGGTLGATSDLTFNTGSSPHKLSVIGQVSASSNILAGGYMSASSYAIDGGTIIDANANISCGEITMQSGVGVFNFTDNEISGSGNISGSQFYGDGTTLSGVPLNTSVPNGVVHVANATSKTITTDSNFTYNGSDLVLVNGDFKINTSGDVHVINGNVTASGHVSASTFYGDGSNLENVSATPQYRYQYINSVIKMNTNLVTSNSFQFFPPDADGLAQSSDRTTHFVMPGSGSIERVIMTPSFYNTNGSSANVFTTAHTPQFFVRKNDITEGTPISGIALQMTASSANMKPLDLPNNAGTLNTQIVIFDVANNSPAITGSNSFDPGDILIFSGRNDAVVSDVAITIVLKIEEEGVTYP